MNTTVLERFWAKVNKDGPIPSHCPELGQCWVWTASTVRGGYGLCTTNKPRIAHRVAWEWENGPIPDGKLLCHRCDNPACVRTSHLFVGTQSENLMDASVKGRIARGSRNGNSRLTESQVAEIKRRHVRGNGALLAREFGVDKTIISNIMRGLIWKHVSA